MKKNLIKSTFMLMALAAAVLTSCSKDEIQDEPSDGIVRFTAGVSNHAVQDGSPTTKAAGTAWAAGDAIGIFMVNNGTTTVAENAVNRQHTTTGDGNFTAAAGHEIYYPMDGSAVDFIAYYPHTPGVTISGAISVNVAGTQDATKQAACDLLWTKANGTAGAGYSKTSGSTVALAFDHKLAKIVMNVKVAGNTGIVANDFNSASVVINGMSTETNMYVSDGILEAPTEPANITPRKLTAAASGFLASYDAIILPHTYDTNVVTVVFTVNSEPYTWKLTTANAAFVGGNEYTYEVELTRTGVNVIGTINPWTGINRGGVIAE